MSRVIIILFAAVVMVIFVNRLTAVRISQVLKVLKIHLRHTLSACGERDQMVGTHKDDNVCQANLTMSFTSVPVMI